jgi:parallel beta-helix repeat protein
VFFNNTGDFYVRRSSGVTSYNSTNTLFLPDSGVYENYTNISISDYIDSVSAEYVIHWATPYAPPLPGTSSFNNKYISISELSGTGNISSIVWHWNDAEVPPGYNESDLKLWSYYYSDWFILNYTPDISANTLSLSDEGTSYGTYGLLNGSVICQCDSCATCNALLNTHFCDYVNLTADISSTDTCIEPYRADDKTFDCQGHSITGNNTEYSRGVDLSQIENLTVRDCSISNYYVGIWATSSSSRDNHIINNTLTSNYMGVFLGGSHNNQILGNTVSGSTTEGIYVISSDSTNIFGNTISGNTNHGLYLSGSDDNTAEGNHYYGNGVDFATTDNGGGNDIYLVNEIFDSPGGLFQNYTNLSLSDYTTGPYNITWSAQPAPLASEYNSFQNKWVEMSGALGIDSVTFHWTAAEESGYDASSFDLLYYNGTYQNTGATLGTQQLSMTDLNEEGVYGIVELVDTTAPTVELVSPADGAVLSTSSVELVYNATDDQDPELDCTILLDGAVSSANPTVADGLHTWNVTCTDDSNNSATSDTWSFTVDTTAPTVEIVSPTNSTYGVTSIPLSYTATDAEACWYVLDGGASASLPGCANITLAALAEGTHTATVYANDSAGNEASDSVTFTVDLSGPEVTIISPENTTYATTTVPLSYTATDAETCWYVLDGGASASLPGCANITMAALAEGTHTVTVYANDSVGNEGSDSVTFTIELDAEAPVVTLLSPPDGTTLNTTSVTLEYNVTDDTDPAPSCTIYLDGSETPATTTVSEGVHSWNVSCTDASGKTGYSDTWTFTVELEANAPVVALISPPDGAVLIVSNTTLVYNASDAEDESVTCELYVNGELVDTATVSGEASVEYNDMEEGSYDWHVICTDSDSNTETSDTWSFTVSFDELDFEIIDGEIVPNACYNAEFTVLGSAITYGGLYDMPVTTKLRIGDDYIMPWGHFHDADDGNVNDDDNPRTYMSEAQNAGEPISILGRSWAKRWSWWCKWKPWYCSWYPYMTVDSAQSTPYVYLLRDGDPVPDIPGYQDQDSIADYVADYVDEGYMALGNNQVIFLYELASPLYSSGADFQDLVVLVSLNPAECPEPDPQEPCPWPCCPEWSGWKDCPYSCHH